MLPRASGWSGVTRLVAATSIALAAACGGSDDGAPEHSTTSAQAKPAGLKGAQGDGFSFRDVTRASGITLVNVSGDAEHKLAIPENIGQGGAALDYDGDGRLDLFVANGDVLPGQTPRGPTRCALYRNLGDMRFEDVTDAAGLAFEAWCHGAHAVDFDADGDTDLYVTIFSGPNRFFENQGDGTFADAGARWGGADPGPSTASAFFDADGDGDLDLYVANYVDYDPEHPPNDGRPCEWKGLAVSCGPRGTTAAADTFWENSDGALALAGEAFGFASVRASYTLGSVAGDLDADGDVDLYVANDSDANYLFINQGGGRFEESAMLFGVDMNEDGRPQAGMGVELADVDDDGLFDLFVTNFSHDSNSLYHAFKAPSGATMFSDATYAMDLGRSSYDRLSWGTRAVDLDLDGRQDLVVVSGHVYPQVDDAPVGSSYRQKNQVFVNRGPQGDGPVRFDELAAAAGDAFALEKVSRGLVTADLDDDGDVDLLVVELDEAPTLIRNDCARKGAWVGFHLRGGGGNRDAIGAVIDVEDAAGVVRRRARTSGASYLSSGDPRLHVGLGAARGPLRRVTVRWPSGAVDVHEGLAVERYWVLEEGGGVR